MRFLKRNVELVGNPMSLVTVLVGILAITGCSKKKNDDLTKLAIAIFATGNSQTSNTIGTSADTTSPTVSSVTPVSGATGVAINSNLTATFSETLSSSSVSATSFILKQGTTTISGAVTLSGNVATFKPDANLTGNTTYTATLTTSIKDASNNALAANYTWTFTTGAAVAEALATPTFSPAAGYYATAQNVTISTVTSGANVYYTTDGTTPTVSSTLYSAAVHIWSLAGKTVKAIANKSGVDSAVLSGIFSYPPLKSGQTTVYAAGDNGTNQTGVARGYTGPTQHETYTSDYTTTDTATGLVWKTCTQGLSGATCATGTAVTLIWANASADATNGCTALNSVNSGNGYAGLKTWRVPTRQELETLPDYGKATSPAINTTAFPATVANYYWSSTTYASSTTVAWGVDFSFGIVTNLNKFGTHYVRCVSGL